MICLTGDVHQPIGSMDQRVARLNEPACALRWAEIAASHGLKATLFVAGRAVIEHPVETRTLAGLGHVAIGGHTYSCFLPRPLFRVLRLVSGAAYGPAWYQRWDAARTVRLIEGLTGEPCLTWRTHAFRSDARTYEAVRRAGVRVISDEVTGPEVTHPRRLGVISLPLNTLDDHTHLYHGLRTPEHVRRKRAAGTGGVGIGPDPESYSPAEWVDRVLRQVEEIASSGGIATILAHPICMHVAGDFRSFERLCRALRGHESIWAHEVR
ncbi:MAG: polysaccharide deacetylase family protein [Anaerolineales bacterium]